MSGPLDDLLGLKQFSVNNATVAQRQAINIVCPGATIADVNVSGVMSTVITWPAIAGITEAAIRAAMATNAGDLPLNSHKITGLAPGSASTDAATVGQLASAGSPSELVFSTQQAAGGRVYTDLALFQAAITAQLPGTLVFDGTYADPCVLSANLDCRGAKITGNGTNCFLTIADGKVLSNYGFQSALVVTSRSNAACLSPLGGGGSYFLTLTDYASVVAPYAPALACMSSNTYTIILDHNASLGDGTNPVISAAGAAGVTIMASAGSHVEAQATTTAIGAVTTIKSLDPSVVVDAQTVTGSPPGTCTITRVVPAGADIAANGTIAKMQGTVVDMTGATAGQALGVVDVLGTPTIKSVASAGVWQYATALAITPITLSGLQTVDGVALTAGMIVLCVAQADPTKNGPWTVNTSPWTRPGWFATGTLAVKSWITVQVGVAYAGTAWKCINNGPATIGTANLFFEMSPNYVPWPVDASTMYYWQCAEQSGNMLYDSGPNAAHVTLAGLAGTDYTRTVQLTPHQAQLHNLCPTLENVAQFTLPVAVAATSDFTIDFVCQWDATQYTDYGPLFELGDGGGVIRWRVCANANHYLYVFVDDSHGARCDSVSQAWFGGPVHHIGVAWTNGVGGKIYVDGVPISETIQNTALPALQYAAIAGWSHGQSGSVDPCFRGTVSNVHISSVARPASYFQQQYAYTLHG